MRACSHWSKPAERERSPFGFSLTIAQVATDIRLGFTGTDTATISTPLADPLLSETSTGQDARLDINFFNRTLAVIPGTEATYQAFIAQVADQPTADFTLAGSANGALAFNLTGSS